MGAIYKRGSIWWIAYYSNGKQRFESSGSCSHDDAKSLLRTREGDIERGIPVTPKMNRITFAEAAEMVVNDYKANDRRSTAAVERRIKLHLTPEFGKRKLASITTADVTGFATKRKEADASNAEINRELAILKRAFNLAHEAKKVSFVPKIRPLKEHNRRTGFFEKDQFEAVRKRLSPALQAVVTFAYVTGWRIRSEVLTLEWRNVDFKAGTITLETSKNDEPRVFPLDAHAELKALLERQKAGTDALQRKRGIVCRYVFHRNGRPIRDFYAAWRTACKEAGCPGRIPHDFRRTACRNLIQVARVDEAVAMRLTGHKTRSVFDRYHITKLDDLRTAVKRLSDATITKQLQSAVSAS